MAIQQKVDLGGQLMKKLGYILSEKSSYRERARIFHLYTDSSLWSSCLCKTPVEAVEGIY